ncbi:MAG TPA: PilZ domain-containing protein [Terriglobales bacterium]|nr:PilZ domain-containing protein [Terriglobales bacterium]
MSEQSANASLDRLDKRIHVALPIRVTCWHGASKPSLEVACTYDISARGARVTGLRAVKQAGEIIAVERGRSRVFCRVVWVGETDSELPGQVGIQCVDSERTMWEAELRDMEEVYEAMRQGGLHRLQLGGSSLGGNRRRHPRYLTPGIAVLSKLSPTAATEASLKNLSELGCLLETTEPISPGLDLKLVLNVSRFDFSVKGRVRHSLPKLGAGIEFREIRRGDRQVLEYLLRKFGQALKAGTPASLLAYASAVL